MMMPYFHFRKYSNVVDLPSSITFVSLSTGSGQPVNGAIPSLPSPTMPTFNMAAQTPNGQPAGTEAVYTNGIPQAYPGRKYNDDYYDLYIEMLIIKSLSEL